MSALETARSEYAKARAASEAATPGGLHGDPAVLSGVRRRGGHRSDARRHAAYDREAAAAARLRIAEASARADERAAVRAAADAAAPCDIGALRPGDGVRTKSGWHRVVKVNAKSVTVETPWSWSDRIPHAKVIETFSGATS
jgi:hypothetical protein